MTPNTLVSHFNRDLDNNLLTCVLRHPLTNAEYTLTVNTKVCQLFPMDKIWELINRNVKPDKVKYNRVIIGRMRYLFIIIYYIFSTS